MKQKEASAGRVDPFAHRNCPNWGKGGSYQATDSGRVRIAAEAEPGAELGKAAASTVKEKN